MRYRIPAEWQRGSASRAIIGEKAYIWFSMGKKSRQPIRVPRVAPTPVVRVEAKKQVETTHESSAAATKTAAESAAAAAVAKSATTAVTDGGEAMPRKDQVAAMPRMGSIT